MKKLILLSTVLILATLACGEGTEKAVDSTIESTTTTMQAVEPKTCSDVALGSVVVTDEYMQMCADSGDLLVTFPCPDEDAVYLTGFNDLTIAMHIGLAPRIMPNEYTDIELMSMCDWASV
jgi:ABC-type Fe3+-hydroxamate transport system substrate-binding protein